MLKLSDSAVITSIFFPENPDFKNPKPWIGVRETVNKSAASAASLDYIKFQAVIKSAAGAAPLRGGRASGRLDHGFFVQFLGALAAKNNQNLRLS